jgi:hypothetical protein
VSLWDNGMKKLLHLSPTCCIVDIARKCFVWFSFSFLYITHGLTLVPLSRVCHTVSQHVLCTPWQQNIISLVLRSDWLWCTLHSVQKRKLACRTLYNTNLLACFLFSVVLIDTYNKSSRLTILSSCKVVILSYGWDPQEAVRGNHTSVGIAVFAFTKKNPF